MIDDIAVRILALMRYPLMPTGVEHTATQVVIVAVDRMRYPLMPTGVEHRLYLSQVMSFEECVTL